jgi:hypothetical protein
MIVDENNFDEISHKSQFEDDEVDEEKLVVFNKDKDKFPNDNLIKEFPNYLSSKKNLDGLNYRPLTFKNYIPSDPNFMTDKLIYYEHIIEIENNYEKRMRKIVKEFLNLEKNPLNIVPKKNNLDLKRNLAFKLEKLNKRTELAILDMIKLNLQNQKEEIVNEKNEEKEGNKLYMATNLHMNIQQEDLKNSYLDEEEQSDISSDYDKGL